jgi:hypothetical protein
VKNLSLVALLCLMNSLAFASPVTLQCEFLAKSKLKNFSIVLNNNTAKIKFSGVMDSVEDLDPSGESVVLNNDSQSSDWTVYRGLEVVKHEGGCTYYIETGCAAPARDFVLNFANSELKSTKEIKGGLAFTPMSGYFAVETYVPHSITCVRK